MEVLTFEPWQFKRGSKERGDSWEKISNSLNGLPEPYFKVTGRSTRDHVNLLIEKFKKKDAEENKASGITCDLTDYDVAIANVYERFQQSESNFKDLLVQNNAKVDADNLQAIEMRKRSLETCSESEKRNGRQETNKKSRNNGNETISYLKEKSEMEINIRKEELEVKRIEVEAQGKTMQQMMQQQNNMMQAMMQQQASFLEILSKFLPEKK
ncbi:uncharacterized protein LOC136076595 [Hydra vulgaris]|uniref:Uncharacterized protein LOC136076595 n=1 Tax=Hydra vulgaris TaxID=6087 RepID=A0ABM4BAN2_HYDVU